MELPSNMTPPEPYEPPVFTKEVTMNGKGRFWKKVFPKSGNMVVLNYNEDDDGYTYIVVGSVKADGTISDEDKAFRTDTEGVLEAVEYFNDLADKQEPPPPPPWNWVDLILATFARPDAIVSAACTNR